jgi:hypothetical protein
LKLSGAPPPCFQRVLDQYEVVRGSSGRFLENQGRSRGLTRLLRSVTTLALSFRPMVMRP